MKRNTYLFSLDDIEDKDVIDDIASQYHITDDDAKSLMLEFSQLYCYDDLFDELGEKEYNRLLEKSYESLIDNYNMSLEDAKKFVYNFDVEDYMVYWEWYWNEEHKDVQLDVDKDIEGNIIIKLTGKYGYHTYLYSGKNYKQILDVLNMYNKNANDENKIDINLITDKVNNLMKGDIK